MPTTSFDPRILAEKPQAPFNNSISYKNGGSSFRFLLLVTQMEPAGAQNAAIKLAKGLEELGHQATIAAMYDKGGFVPLFREMHRLEIVDLHMKESTNHIIIGKLLSLITGIMRMWRLFRSGSFDALITFTHYSNIVGPVLGYYSGIPVRITSQRSLTGSYNNWIGIFNRIITNSRMVDAMTAVSNAVRDDSITREHIRPDKIETIYTGIDIEKYRSDTEGRNRIRRELGLKDDNYVIVNIARHHPIKGHRYLLEAMAAILEQAPHCRLLLAGDGPLRRDIETQIRELGIEREVIVLGNRDDVPALLTASDLMVVSSLEEGLPNVVLEGMAAGLPIVATEVGGIPELVTHYSTGILIQPSDAEALSNAVLEMISNNPLALHMSKQGRAKVATDFTAEQTTKNYLTLVNQIFNDKNNRK